MNEIRVQIWGVPSMGSHRVGHDWSDLAAAAARWWNATFPMQTFKRERHFFVNHRGALLVAQMVKNPPAMWETWAWSLGWEDPLKEGMTTHSRIFGFPGRLRQEKICLQCRRPRFYSWVRKIPWRRDRLPSPVFLGLLGSSDGKESTCNVGDPGLIRGSGRSPEEGIGYPLQHSWASLVAQLVKNLCLQCRRPGFDSWVGKIPWRRDRLLTPAFLGFPCGSAGIT